MRCENNCEYYANLTRFFLEYYINSQTQYEGRNTKGSFNVHVVTLQMGTANTNIDLAMFLDMAATEVKFHGKYVKLNRNGV